MTVMPPNALTMGEPAGIGGEITLKAWFDHRQDVSPFFTVDSPDRLRKIASRFNLNVAVIEINDPSETAQHFLNALPVISLQNQPGATLGSPAPEDALAVLESIERCLAYTSEGKAASIVTNPIHKETLYKSGFKFPGHTEYLANLLGDDITPVMMLASPMLRVVPVTVHMSLRNALDTLTSDLIVKQGKIVINALRNDFGIATPCIAIAGINPHAGEGGTLGAEDQSIVAPAVAELRALGAKVLGPVPPDALFTERARRGYDAALCMYHDQALIPIKALDVDRAVNITLGLPVVRTSPDHGTAIDIASQGIANPSSLVAAMTMATKIAAHRAKVSGQLS